MRNIHKKVIATLLIVFLLLVDVCFNNQEVYADGDNNYLVLIQQKSGSWKGYTGFIETSENGYLMIKARRISKALGFTYIREGSETFIIKKTSSIYNNYTRKSKEYTYTNGAMTLLKKAPEKAYTSDLSKYHLCQVSSLNTLVYYKCFSGEEVEKVEEYSEYDGVVCFSKYKDIPESVPIIELNTAKEPTPTPESEPSSITVEGVEFPVRDEFLKVGKALSDWGGTATLWSELERKIDGKIIVSTNLNFDSKKIEFTHLGLGSDGVSLTRSEKGYKLAISVKLKGSVIADQNASIVKAMVATISSKPSLVYEAIFDSFTSDETHKINEDTFVTIGDCKLKVSVKNGIVTYEIRDSK